MRAMILAAGRGERMRPLTDVTPKPLLRVGGKPLIVWHIERLARAGFNELVINHAWLGQQIEDQLGNGRQFGVDIHYSAETDALETAGGIAKALDLLGPAPFLVMNGDIWCDWPAESAVQCAQMLSDHAKLAWLLLVDNPPHHPAGDFVLHKDGAVADQSESESSAYTFAGIGIYRPELFDDIAIGSPAPLAPLLRTAMRADKVIGSHHDGRWVDVGTPQRLQDLDNTLSRHVQG